MAAEKKITPPPEPYILLFTFTNGGIQNEIEIKPDRYSKLLETIRVSRLVRDLLRPDCLSGQPALNLQGCFEKDPL